MMNTSLMPKSDNLNTVISPPDSDSMKGWSPFRRRNSATSNDYSAIELVGPGKYVAEREVSEMRTSDCDRMPGVMQTPSLGSVPISRRTTVEELQKFQDGKRISSRDIFANVSDSHPAESSDDDSVSAAGGLDEDYFSDDTDILLPDAEEEERVNRSLEKGRVVVIEPDLCERIAKRTMTPTQEVWNAITVIPTALYCLHYLFAGKWLTLSDIEAARITMMGAAGLEEAAFSVGEVGSLGSLAQNLLVEKDGCLRSSLFPNLYALPPLPVAAIALGVAIHAPCSFLYHWLCAFRLPKGYVRMDHWSRRLDQCMIHAISVFFSYGASGSWDYVLASAAFNLESMYRQCETKIRPRRNVMRIGLALVIQTLPYVRRGEMVMFLQLIVVYALSSWFFAAYPFGGWSHCVFHIVIAMSPPIVLAAATTLAASQPQIELAAKCAALSDFRSAHV